MELLGDNPLVHSTLIDDVVEFYKSGGYDYAATATKEYPVLEKKNKLFSIGIRVQVYSAEIAQQWSDYPGYAEDEYKHPTAYIFDHPETYKIGYFEARDRWSFMNRPALTFAVNYQKNFNLIRSIFEKNYPEDPNFALEKVYQQLDEEKHLYLLMGD